MEENQECSSSFQHCNSGIFVKNPSHIQKQTGRNGIRLIGRWRTGPRSVSVQFTSQKQKPDKSFLICVTMFIPGHVRVRRPELTRRIRYKGPGSKRGRQHPHSKNPTRPGGDDHQALGAVGTGAFHAATTATVRQHLVAAATTGLRPPVIGRFCGVG